MTSIEGLSHFGIKREARRPLYQSAKQLWTFSETDFIGTDFDIHEDLSGKLPEEWKEFNKQFIIIPPDFGQQVKLMTDVQNGHFLSGEA